MVSGADMCSASCPHCAWCLVLGACWSKVLWVCNTRIRVVMSCHVHRCPRRRLPWHPRGRITSGHRHNLACEARIFGLLGLAPQQTQACHGLDTATTASRLHSGQSSTMLASAAGCLRGQPRGLPSLPMTTFCLFAPPGQPNDEPWCRIPRGQNHVATSFATGMLHRPCVARLIAGIRGRAHTRYRPEATVRR
jgi:hypothetical protein